MATPAQRLVTRRYLLKIAAGGAAVATGSALWAWRYRSWTRMKTAVGEFRQVTLPDSSSIELNTDTQISWRLDPAGSVIRLERGEIALRLQPGTATALFTTPLSATLLGGHYNAQYITDLLRLTVVEGTALVDERDRSPASRVATAVGGQTITAATARAYKIEPEANMEAATAWQKGEIVFHDEPLITAIAAYNRYLTKKIILEAPAARSQRVGGRFTTTNPQAFLRAVTIALDLQSTETDASYLLAPKI